MRGQHDRRRPAAGGPKPSQQFHAIHSRHFQIGDQNVRPEGFQLLERFFAIRRSLHRVAPQRDHAGQSRALGLFVIHYQDPREGAFGIHLPLL